MSTSASTIFSPPVTAEDLEKRAPTQVDETVVGSRRPSEENSKRPSAEDKDMVGASVKNDDEKTSRLVDTLDPHESPKTFLDWEEMGYRLVLGMGTTFATAASSIHSFAEQGVMDAFGVSLEVSILGISLFVLGIGIGPLLMGPLSELYGRNIIYRASYFVFFAFSFAVAFAPDIATFLVFRFLCGMCGAAFLSVAAGSVSDMFINEHLQTPLGAYIVTPFLGPTVGPLVSGFINQRTDWRWTYRLLIIMTFVQLVALLVVVPETYEPVLLKRKAARLRKETGNEGYYAPLDRAHPNLISAIAFSCYKPFELLFHEPMCLLLAMWNSLVLGILYLAFEAFPLIYEKHGFSEEHIGLTFIGFGLGMLIGFATMPLCNKRIERVAREVGGKPPIEVRLFLGQAGGVCAAVGLYWIAFTSYASVPWILPVLGSVLFGVGVYQIFVGSFTYLVVVYRTYAASMMAGNAFMRSSFAAGFPLFAGQMYTKLGTVGATALLAGLTTLMIPLPFVFYKIGARIRATSRNADKTLPG